ncbi:Outer membrane protein assembly factor YaeT [hydrothermal vent metagenome]|uniref:Outer membrane protein assembly factor YaeT n=1 Tax=hydrothermal vent metagenome TaxID=652676 RepID=A0A3B0W0Q4_9ZZZZ
MVDMKQIKFKKRAISSAVSCLLLLPSLAYAFTVKNIEVEGANRIDFATISTYLPISKGEFLDRNLSQKSIQSLYKTGFFKDISLYKKGSNTLVIKVVERPSISEVTIEGNKLIDSDTLNEALDSLGLKKGRIYNHLELERVVVDLSRRYQNQGYYAAKIEINSDVLPRNRVALKVSIEEGEPATIGRITLVGNKMYSDQRLKSLLQMSVGDAYSKMQLQGDIETLKSYYMDLGFAKFQVSSFQVSLSTDKTRVFTTINIDEGEQYSLSDIQFIGETILDNKTLHKLMGMRVDGVFSRSKVISAVNSIRDRLSEEGYAFAEVRPETDLDDANKTIALRFHFEPKNRVYIRRIVVEGNTRTRDYVIRREMRQLESAPYSLKLVRQSTSRLTRLGFFKQANIETKRVSADQVDLIVRVEEQSTGSFSAGVGFSQLDGVSFNIGISERNFIGSGNKLDFSVATSAARKTADIGLTNPYFTDDGVSLGAGFYLSEIDANQLLIADFSTNNFGIRTSLGYPLSENDRLTYGLKLDSQELVCSDTFNACNDHVAEFGQNSSAAIASMAWSHNSTNSFYFPSKGHKTRISMESVVPGTSDQPYYKLYLDEGLYYPISSNLTLQLKGNVSYGGAFGKIDTLPFYRNFYAGGIGSVRGFEPNSLGANYNDADDGTTRPKGGAVKVATTAAMVLPIPFIEDSSNMRMSLFFDAGNIFTDLDTVDVGEFRSSMGVGVSWITPVGPLSFSFAWPIAYEKTDELQSFQFVLGSGF